MTERDTPERGGRSRAKHVGVAAIPNICAICGKFRPWGELITHFVPDTAFSSESESWRECKGCLKKAGMVRCDRCGQRKRDHGKTWCQCPIFTRG